MSRQNNSATLVIVMNRLMQAYFSYGDYFHPCREVMISKIVSLVEVA